MELIKSSIHPVKTRINYLPPPSRKIAILVDALRLVSEDKEIKERELYIPDDCEKYGFVEGDHNLGQLLHFLADMLEE
ncbi:MAG: hypothetical protein KF721_11825 [Ignavibacteriaceae bacterium]|nr:hypothetical protein [Ignavibacteriaceae bacterium]